MSFSRSVFHWPTVAGFRPKAEWAECQKRVLAGHQSAIADATARRSVAYLVKGPPLIGDCASTLCPRLFNTVPHLSRLIAPLGLQSLNSNRVLTHTAIIGALHRHAVENRVGGLAAFSPALTLGAKDVMFPEPAKGRFWHSAFGRNPATARLRRLDGHRGLVFLFPRR